jgi:hypothetical protein
MSTPAEPKTLIIASAVLVTISAGVYFGTRTVERTPDTENPRAFVVQWQDGGPAAPDVRCVWTTALVSDQPLPLPDGGFLPSPLAAYGARTDAGPQYAYARVCGEMPEDGGPSEEEGMPDLPPGMEALEFDQLEEPYDGGPQLRVILQGEPGWPCACARYPDVGDCERQALNFETWEFEWAAAVHGMTFGAGQWRGDDCFPKACNELSGTTSSWPAECGPP